MKNFAIYLRKSRADAELEKRGEGETLARHRAALTEYAKSHDLNVVKVYEEIVSGESIVSRPQMQQLMRDVEQGLYSGVLVMEIERLARGDSIDQGLVAQTFKASNTLIITPYKTYDPNNDIDEEYFEFGLFMSRREYKTINRRLKQGLYASAKEGKWLSPKAPYGYKRVPLSDKKGTTLKPVEEQAAVVRMIFDLYVNGLDNRRLGIQAIARHLNELGIPPATKDYWMKATIQKILNNPVYAGKIRYGYRKSHQIIIDGHKKSTRPMSCRDDYVLAEGLHPAIVPPELFEQAQQYAEARPIMPVGYRKEIKNPLAGLIICKLCGRRMVMRKACRPNNPDYLVCHARACPNVSSPLYIVKDRLIQALENWIKGYETTISAPVTDNPSAQNNILLSVLQSKEKELETLQKQLSSTYDLLEQGLYTADIFRERSQSLQSRIAETTSDIDRISKQIEQSKKQEQAKAIYLPHVKSLMQAYKDAETPAEKNKILSEILEKAVYYKEKSAMYKGIGIDDFELEIFPKLPESE